MNEVDAFVSMYNKYLEEKKKSFSDVKLITRRDGIKIAPATDDLLAYFLNAFEFPITYPYAGFSFEISEIEGANELIPFAFHAGYNLSYVNNLKDKKVYLWDVEREAMSWPC